VCEDTIIYDGRKTHVVDSVCSYHLLKVIPIRVCEINARRKMMHGLSPYAPRTPQNNVVCQRLQLGTKMGVYFARTEATPRRASTLYGGVRGATVRHAIISMGVYFANTGSDKKVC